jgi:uncharacterized protein (TIGR03067 family)
MPSPLLHGRWQMIRAELSGEIAPELVAQRTILEITGPRYAVRFDGKVVDSGSCDIPDSAAAREFVLRGERGPNAGRIVRCIYQLVGDRLRVCYGLDAVTPTGFTTATGEARYLATYRRLA